MARVIDKLPPRAHRAGRSLKYPIAEWLDGRVWVILYGEDYRCKHAGIHSLLHRHAKRLGGMIEGRRVDEDGEQIGWAIQYTQLRNGSAAA